VCLYNTMWFLRWLDLLLLLFSLGFSLEESLSLYNLTCSNSLKVVVSEISLECEEYCSLGKEGNFSAKISYEDLESVKLILQIDFSAIYNISNSYAYYFLNTGEDSLSQSLSFSEIHDVCNSYNCGDGEFELTFQYTIPTFGYLDNFVIGTYIQIFFLSFDNYERDKVIGACQALFSSFTEEIDSASTDITNITNITNTTNITTTTHVISSSSGYIFYGTIAVVSLGTFLLLFLKRKNKDETDELIDILKRRNAFFLERGREQVKGDVLNRKIFQYLIRRNECLTARKKRKAENEIAANQNEFKKDAATSSQEVLSKTPRSSAITQTVPSAEDFFSILPRNRAIATAATSQEFLSKASINKSGSTVVTKKTSNIRDGDLLYIDQDNHLVLSEFTNTSKDDLYSDYSSFDHENEVEKVEMAEKEKSPCCTKLTELDSKKSNKFPNFLKMKKDIIKQKCSNQYKMF